MSNLFYSSKEPSNIFIIGMDASTLIDFDQDRVLKIHNDYHPINLKVGDRFLSNISDEGFFETDGNISIVTLAEFKKILDIIDQDDDFDFFFNNDGILIIKLNDFVGDINVSVSDANTNEDLKFNFKKSIVSQVNKKEDKDISINVLFPSNTNCTFIEDVEGYWADLKG